MIVNPPPHALQRVRAAASLGLRNVAVWTDQAMDYTTGLSRYFKERFAEFGGKIAHEDSYTTSDTDFSAQVSRLKSAGDVDGVFASSGPATAGPIVSRSARRASTCRSWPATVSTPTS